MPRKKFVMAKDAASRTVDCACYSFNGGAPYCDALTHPWCLAPGEAPSSCKFRIPSEKPRPAKRKKKPEAEDHAEAD